MVLCTLGDFFTIVVLTASVMIVSGRRLKMRSAEVVNVANNESMVAKFSVKGGNTYPVLHKELLAAGEGEGSHPIWRVTFGLPPNQKLGLVPGRADCVRVNPVGTRCKSRSYSPSSDPERIGSFDLAVKAYRDGCTSKYIGSLKIGDQVSIGMKKKSKRRSSSTVQLGLIAMGIGVTEVVAVAREELKSSSSSEVVMLYANRYHSDRVLLDEIARLQSKYGARFRLQDILSRDSHKDALQGRINADVLRQVFDFKHEGARFHCVGSGKQKRDVWRMLAAAGYPQGKYSYFVKGGKSESVGGRRRKAVGGGGGRRRRKAEVEGRRRRRKAKSLHVEDMPNDMALAAYDENGDDEVSSEELDVADSDENDGDWPEELDMIDRKYE